MPEKPSISEFYCFRIVEHSPCNDFYEFLPAIYWQCIGRDDVYTHQGDTYEEAEIHTKS